MGGGWGEMWRRFGGWVTGGMCAEFVQGTCRSKGPWPWNFRYVQGLHQLVDVIADIGNRKRPVGGTDSEDSGFTRLKVQLTTHNGTLFLFHTATITYGYGENFIKLLKSKN